MAQRITRQNFLAMILKTWNEALALSDQKALDKLKIGIKRCHVLIKVDNDGHAIMVPAKTITTAIGKGKKRRLIIRPELIKVMHGFVANYETMRDKILAERLATAAPTAQPESQLNEGVTA